ncbi:MAG: class I SAM-dependent methyltransferase [Mycobacterium sp.]
MSELGTVDPSIAAMPRGGPTASWLDRRLQTDELEFTDRYDIPDEIKQSVVSALDRMGSRFGLHEKNARAALSVVADIANPRILELGAGHGKLSAKLVELHPSATVTVSDLDPTSVANIAASDLGAQPRVRTQVIDATAIEADDKSYDLVVFAASFHHLPPATAMRAIAEGTRVGDRFLVIDLKRQSLLGLVFTQLIVAPIAKVAVKVRAPFGGILHDGYISALRAYSRSAFIALGEAADPQMRIQFPPTSTTRFGPNGATYLFTRSNTTLISRNHLKPKDSRRS